MVNEYVGKPASLDIFSGFNPRSRIWIYQSDRNFTDAETDAINKRLEHFAASWLSHGAKVHGAAAVFHNRFIILASDEEAVGVSGCSTDSSVKAVREIGLNFNADLFARTSLAFLIDGVITAIPLSELPGLVAAGKINAETPFFDTSFSSLAEWEANWPTAAGATWLGSRFKLS